MKQQVLQVQRQGMKKQLFVQKGVQCSLEELKGWTSEYWKEHIVEAKIDGLRAVYVKGKFYSMTGKPLYNLEWLEKRLNIQGSHMYVLDGEIYGKSWEDTMSVVKSSKTKQDTKFLTFYPFDCVSSKEFIEGVSTQRLKERLERLDHNLRRIRSLYISLSVERVSFEHCRNFREFKAFYEKVLKQGYEGVMIKRLPAYYQYCVDKSWKKIKTENTEDVYVIGFKEGEGKYIGMLGALVCKTNKKVKVNVSGFTDSLRKRIWKNKSDYFGKCVEVKYLKKTKDGKLYSPRFVRWRDDKLSVEFK